MPYGGQKYSLAAAGNILSWPSHTLDPFLVHLDLGEVGFISMSSVPAVLWSQHTTSAVPWGWRPWLHSRPAQFCAGVSPGGASPATLPASGSPLLCHVCLGGHTVRGADNLAWDTETSLVFWFGVLPISPCASLPGCVRAVVAAQAKGWWRARTIGEEEVHMPELLQELSSDSVLCCITAPVLTCLIPQAPREIVMDSAHLLFQNSGGFSAPLVTEIWYLMGLNWGKQCL